METTAQPDQGKLAQLMALFGGGDKSPGMPAAPINGAKDTSADSSAKPFEAPQAAAPESDGLLGALKNLVQFFQAKSGSASNDAKYQKAMGDAGMPEEDMGIGH